MAQKFSSATAMIFGKGNNLLAARDEKTSENMLQPKSCTWEHVHKGQICHFFSLWKMPPHPLGKYELEPPDIPIVRGPPAFRTISVYVIFHKSTLVLDRCLALSIHMLIGTGSFAANELEGRSRGFMRASPALAWANTLVFIYPIHLFETNSGKNKMTPA